MGYDNMGYDTYKSIKQPVTKSPDPPSRGLGGGSFKGSSKGSIKGFIGFEGLGVWG